MYKNLVFHDFAHQATFHMGPTATLSAMFVINSLFEETIPSWHYL